MDESSERKIMCRTRRAEFAEKLADLEQEAQDIEDEAAHDATESSPANFEDYHTKAGARLQNLQTRYFHTPASSFKEPRPPHTKDKIKDRQAITSRIQVSRLQR
jgi:hypothetical protein